MTTRTNWTRRLLGSAIVGTASLYLGLQAYALTPAGTEIRNQSVATYKDANLQSQISTSNEVINIVQQVYGVEITPDKSGGVDAPFDYANTPALTQTTAPGNVAYYHYYLKNTGNTPDTYDLTTAFQAAGGVVIVPNGVEVYYDANGNGQVDAGDILLATNVANQAATPIVAQDATIPLIVAVKTPTSALDTQQINTDIDAESNGGAGTTDAISNWSQTLFSASTGILTASKSANVSSAVPGQTLTYTVEGSNTGSADVFAVVYAIGGPPAVSIDLDSDGNAEAREGILIIDELDPAKLVIDAAYPGAGPFGYAGIAAPTVLGPTKARILYWHQANNRWHLDAADAAWTTTPKIALFIPDADSVEANAAGNGLRGSVLTPGQGYKFTFQANVQSPYSTAQAKLIENQVVVSYAKNAAGDLIAAESNKALVTVGADPLTATAGVAIGPFGYPMADNGALLNLTSADHPAIDAKGLTVAATSDTTAAGIRDAGEIIAFPLTVLNPNEVLPALPKDGMGGPATSPDTYNIVVSNPDPNSFNVVLYKSDGVTPLADTNGDGQPDTGALAPADMANIVVKVFIKADAEVAISSTFTATATSTNDPTKVDTTDLTITEVRPASVDIATRNELGNDDNATAADATATDDDDVTTAAGVNPGAVVVFPIDIGNMRPEAAPGSDTTTSVADTYNLSFTKILGASSFVIQLLKDANGDGVIDDSELVPISDTGWLPAIADVNAIAANEIYNLNVRVQVPLGTPAGDYFVDVKATSTNNPAKFDTMRLLIKVNLAPGIQVLPDNTATVVAGGSYIFSHVVVNTGNILDTVTLSHSVLPNGYSAVWVNCATGAVNGNDDNPNTHTTALIPAPAPGVDNSATVCLKVFVPANAPAGTVLPITVTGQMNSYAPADTALDIITVIDGALQLQKTNVPTAAVPPAGTITYRTTYKNLSPGTLSLAVIADAIPANTKLVVTDASIQALLPSGATVTGANNTYFQYSTNNGISWVLWPADQTTLPGYVAADETASGITNVRFDIGNTSDTATPGGDVPAGEDGWFEFQVIVK